MLQCSIEMGLRECLALEVIGGGGVVTEVRFHVVRVCDPERSGIQPGSKAKNANKTTTYIEGMSPLEERVLHKRITVQASQMRLCRPRLWEADVQLRMAERQVLHLHPASTK